MKLTLNTTLGEIANRCGFTVEDLKDVYDPCRKIFELMQRHYRIEDIKMHWGEEDPEYQWLNEEPGRIETLVDEFENVLGDCDPHWEAYWDALDFAFEELKRELEEENDSD